METIKIKDKKVSIKTSPIESSVLEAVLARGDRRLGKAIETAWQKGCRFDAWRETFRPGAWWEALDECGLDPAWYAAPETTGRHPGLNLTMSAGLDGAGRETE